MNCALLTEFNRVFFKYLQIEFDTDVSSTIAATTCENPIIELDPKDSATMSTADFLDVNVLYELPPFDCENLGKSLVFTLHVRNVDPTSLVVAQQSHSVHVRFQSIGAGHFPQQHAFFVRLDDEQQNCTIRVVQPDVWDNDVIVQLELVSNANENFVHWYEVGLNAQTVQRLRCEKMTNAEDVFEDAEDGDGDTFRMDDMHDALDEFSASPPPPQSPLKQMKQRSYSESNCDDFHTVALDNDEDDMEADGDGEPSGDRVKSPLKTRTYSECSMDSGTGGNASRKCLKGILKRRSSSMLSESQSSFDELCSRSIPEEAMDHSSGSVVSSSTSEQCKKSVRFDNNVRKLLFRFNSTVAGQRKPKVNKRKKKKRCTERRYSEGEASDYDSKTCSSDEAISNGNAAGDAATVSPKAKQNPAGLNSTTKHLHDSGVDLREDAAEVPPQNGGGDLLFKSGMIFELDM